MATMRLEIDGNVKSALIDTLSPLTMEHNLEEGRKDTEVLVMGNTSQGWQSRAAFTSADVWQYALCDAANCNAGETGSFPVEAILGADLLSKNALRFSDQEVTIVPDVVGNSEDRAKRCDAVFSKTMFGGGQLAIADTVIKYTGRRPTVGACLAYNEDPTKLDADEQGVDLTLVIASAVPKTMIGQSAYLRYRNYVGATNAPDVDTLPTAAVSLYGNQYNVALATLPKLALVGQLSDFRGPCWERTANITQRQGNGRCLQGIVCPCDEGELSCRAGAVAQFDKTFDVYVVPDTIPILATVRNELGALTSQVDGLLATGDLQGTVFELDYPNNRVVLACDDANPNCEVFPQIITKGEVSALAQCDSP